MSLIVLKTLTTFTIYPPDHHTSNTPSSDTIHGGAPPQQHGGTIGVRDEGGYNTIRDIDATPSEPRNVQVIMTGNRHITLQVCIFLLLSQYSRSFIRDIDATPSEPRNVQVIMTGNRHITLQVCIFLLLSQYSRSFIRDIDATPSEPRNVQVIMTGSRHITLQVCIFLLLPQYSR